MRTILLRNWLLMIHRFLLALNSSKYAKMGGGQHMAGRRGLANGMSLEERLRTIEARLEEFDGRLGLLDEQARQAFQGQFTAARVAAEPREPFGNSHAESPSNPARLESVLAGLRARIDALAEVVAPNRSGRLGHREV